MPDIPPGANNPSRRPSSHPCPPPQALPLLRCLPLQTQPPAAAPALGPWPHLLGAVCRNPSAASKSSPDLELAQGEKQREEEEAKPYPTPFGPAALPSANCPSTSSPISQSPQLGRRCPKAAPLLTQLPISYVPLPTARTPRHPRPPRPSCPSTVHPPPGRAPMRPSGSVKLSTKSTVYMHSPDPAGRVTSKRGYESAWAGRESPTHPTVDTHHCRPIAGRVAPPSTHLHSPTVGPLSLQTPPSPSGTRH